MKRNRIKVITLILTICMIGLLATKVEAAGVTKLNKTKVVLEVGDKEQLKMKNTSKKVKWSSANKSVVKVNSKGKLTSVGTGSAKVTAKVNGKKYVCRVVVADFDGMSNEQKDVVRYALQYVGNRYVYGGSSLTNGTDCSGFTMSVFKNFGYDLPHNAYGQMVDKSVKKVSMKKIKPGDLIFYGSSKSACSHVALYIGNEKVVHASTESTGITISQYQYRKYVGVGRVLKTETYPAPESDMTPETDGVPEMDTVPGADGSNDSITRYATSK